MSRPATLLSFKTRALLLLGLLQLAGLLVLGLLAYEQSQGVLRQLTEDKFRLTTERVSREVANYVRDEGRMALLLSTIPPIQSMPQVRRASAQYAEAAALYEMWSRHLEQIFLSTTRTHPQCLDIAYLDAEGFEVVRVYSREGHNAPAEAAQLRSAAGEPYFYEAQPLDQGQVYVSPLTYGPDPGAAYPTFWVSTPVSDGGGGPHGVLAIHIDPAELLKRIDNPVPQGRAFLVDQSGHLLYHSGQKPPFEPRYLAEIHPRLAEIMAAAGEQEVYAACESERHPHGAGLCMHGFGRIPYDPLDQDHYWAVVLDAPAEVVFAPAMDLRRRVFGWGALIVALSLGLTLVLSEYMVVRPVVELSRVAGRVAAGDMNPPLLALKRTDEIGRLYAAFGTMVERLREATEHLQEQVAARTAELRTSENQLARQNEELQRLNAYKSHLLSVVSHELKTPLASLDGFNRIINQLYLTDEFLDRFEGSRKETLVQVRRRVERMDQNIQRLIRLVDELLDFSRIDRGRDLEMHWQRVDLGAIAALAVETHREIAAQKGLEMHCEGALQGLWAEADEDRMAQVFDNLLNNAIKFTDAGPGIRLASRQQDGYIEFEIRDSGEGIASEALERIFDLYEQAGSGVTRKQGTGIGLTVSRHIVEAHGGYIRAHSEGPGRGSHFVFGIPADPPSPRSLPEALKSHEI